MFDQFEFAALHPWVHLVWVAPAVVLLGFWGIVRRERTVRIFGLDSERAAPWLRALRRRRWRRSVLLAVSLLFLATAAMQPRCNPEKQTIKVAARDVAVLLDVSRSMLATDLQPSRLERAKDELERFADHLSGDRIGLVVFAGDAVIACPLTRNYTYFKSTLRNVTIQSASQGGTRIGDAIRKALGDLLGVDTGAPAPTEGDEEAIGKTVMEDELRGQKETFGDLLIITDGEDHDSYPTYAARRAAALNVGIYTVGLGSERGTKIPVRGTDGNIAFLKNREGEIVVSKLDSKTLLEMTNLAPRGAYLPVGTQNFNLSDFYDRTIAQDSRRETVESHVYWTEIYQPFLLAGLFFYFLYLLVSERPRRDMLALTPATFEEARA